MKNAANNPPSSSWHEGEVAIQRHAGVAEQMAPIASYVNINHLVEQHRRFFPQLSFVIAGVVDGEGNAWATILSGHPGFLWSPDPATLRVAASPGAQDPAAKGFNDGDAIALLGIALETRRRNRLNGTLRRVDAKTFDVAVEQSYGNCPQYIHVRSGVFTRDPADDASEPAQVLDIFDARATAMIVNASTLFVASYVDRDDGRRQADVSHKGGRAGFVNVGTDGALTIPDFSGNLYFNTLGNIFVNPKCGLAFVDFDTGDLLQITGEGSVIFDGPDVEAFQGAKRLLRVHPQAIVYRPNALPLRWTTSPPGTSPQTGRTGIWAGLASASHGRNTHE